MGKLGSILNKVENMVSWKQLGDFWQKITVNEVGKPSCQHYYRDKNSEPCKRFVLEGKKAKQLQTYQAVEKDLRELKITFEVRRGEWN